MGFSQTHDGLPFPVQDGYSVIGLSQTIRASAAPVALFPGPESFLILPYELLPKLWLVGIKESSAGLYSVSSTRAMLWRCQLS